MWTGDFLLAVALLGDGSLIGLFVWHKLGGWAALIAWFRKKAG